MRKEKNSSISSTTMASASNEVVVRSLRRRLWQAFQKEDGETAHAIFQATRADWERWVRQEAEQARKLQEERRSRKPRVSLLQRRKKKPLGRADSSESADNVPDVPSLPTAPSSSDSGDQAVRLLQLYSDPSEPFVLDDFMDPTSPYDDPVSCATIARPKSHRRRGKNMTAHQAIGFWGRPRGEPEPEVAEEAPGTTPPDTRMTTPLHEAARIGDATLVRAMLQHAEADPNVRNGVGRTSLHMVAGGVALEEAHRLNVLRDGDKDANDAVGLRLPEAMAIEAVLVPEKGKSAKKAVRAAGRFFRDGSQQQLGSTNPAASTDSLELPSPVSDERYETLVRSRRDATLAILSWYHPNDGSPEAGEGPSTNAVDNVGRTALHYAAELGRSDICMQLLASFGTMLTIVDDGSRTPCELASAGKFDTLAAQLEARALLYLDPYGVDDELLAAVLADESGFSHNNLTPPFSWFETLDMDAVQKERNRRVDLTLRKMRKIADIQEEEEKAREVLFLQVVDGKDARFRRIPRDEIALKKYEQSQKAAAKAAKVAGPKTTGEDDDATDKVSAKDQKDPIDGANATGEDKIDADNLLARADESTSVEPATERDDEVDPSKSASEGAPNGTGLVEGKGAPLQAGPTVKEVATGDADEIPLERDTVETGESETESKTTAENSKEAKLVAVADEEESDESPDRALTINLVHKGYVELFLQFHKWNVREALVSFFVDPVDALTEAGIDILQLVTAGGRSRTTKAPTKERTCLICCDDFGADSNDWKQLQGCEHAFCKTCLGQYIADCAKSKTAGLALTCPHHECTTLLAPLEIVNLSPDTDVYGRLIDTANDNFVVSSEDVTFCPHPGCSGVSRHNIPLYVQKSGLDSDLINIAGAVCTAAHDDGDDSPMTYEGVRDANYFNARSPEQPKKAHRFCFECGESEVHWPVTCKRLEEWKITVAEEIKEVHVEDEDDANYNDVAQRLWIKANTRPCPKCKAPIEKDEGCNHVTCSNPRCKHEFCWICRNDWKLHNTETGGFFRCNRWEEQKDHQFYDEAPPRPTEPARFTRPEDLADPSRMEITYGTAMHETRSAGKKSRDMARFLHHYQRYSAHAESAELERKMRDTSCERLAPVVSAAIEFDASPDFNFGEKGLSFVHSAFTELLECRSVLQHSYIFSYFRFTSIHPKRYRLIKPLLKEKLAFEQTQAELEMMTEQISNVVARRHLRATQAQIMFLTATSAEKRKEFSNLMLNLLNRERAEENSEARVGNESAEEKALRERYQSLLRGGRITGLATNRRSADRVPANEDNEAIEQALRASLDDFRANTGSRDVLEIDGENNDDTVKDWPCSACTFMNNGGKQCEMCGTQRS